MDDTSPYATRIAGLMGIAQGSGLQSIDQPPSHAQAKQAAIANIPDPEAFYSAHSASTPSAPPVVVGTPPKVATSSKPQTGDASVMEGGTLAPDKDVLGRAREAMNLAKGGKLSVTAPSPMDMTAQEKSVVSGRSKIDLPTGSDLDSLDAYTKRALSDASAYSSRDVPMPERTDKAFNYMQKAYGDGPAWAQLLAGLADVAAAGLAGYSGKDYQTRLQREYSMNLASQQVANQQYSSLAAELKKYDKTFQNTMATLVAQGRYDLAAQLAQQSGNEQMMKAIQLADYVGKYKTAVAQSNMSMQAEILKVLATLLPEMELRKLQTNIGIVNNATGGAKLNPAGAGLTYFQGGGQ